MNNALDLAGNVNMIVVFLEGILSFFSPCVLPLIPIYLSYLAGNAKYTDEEGRIFYKRTTVMLHTVFFVLGISFAFFLLGISFSAVGHFFSEYKNIFTVIGGIIILFFGLMQLGVLNLKFLQSERRLNIKTDVKKMNPVTAFVMGFTFSFAWTPCVGPALSSVLLMASSAGSAAAGLLLVLLYALGFVIPFLALGLFTAQVMNFLKRRKKVLMYAVKAGGAMLVIIGILMMTGWINSLNTLFSSTGSSSGDTSSSQSQSQTSDSSTAEDEWDYSLNFTLYDQYGNTHSLEDYKGKVVFLNFFATWCGPCNMEMPDIQKLYEEYGYNEKDVVFLGVAMPKSEQNPNNADVSQDEIKAFLEERGYTFPVVFDTTGKVSESYWVDAFPTTYLIDKEGEIFGYVSGMLSEENMRSAIEQTITGERETTEE